MATARRQKGSALRQPQRRPQSSSSSGWPPPAGGERPWYVEEWQMGPTAPPDYQPGPESTEKSARRIRADWLIFLSLIACIVCVVVPLSLPYAAATAFLYPGGMRFATGWTYLALGAAAFYYVAAAMMPSNREELLLAFSVLPIVLILAALLVNSKKRQSPTPLLIGAVLALAAGVLLLPVGALAIVGAFLYFQERASMVAPEPEEFFEPPGAA